MSQPDMEVQSPRMLDDYLEEFTVLPTHWDSESTTTIISGITSTYAR